MKKGIIKYIIGAAFLIIWCLPFKANFLESFVFATGYIAGIIMFISIKNKYISAIASSVVLIPAVILNSKFLFFLFCPYIIILEYIQVFKNESKKVKSKTKDRFYLEANICVISGFIALVYQYYKTDKSFDEGKYDVSQAIIWSMFALCISLASICLSKKFSWKLVSSNAGLAENKFKELRFIHIVNVICFIETLLFYYFANSGISEYNERLFFFPWLIYFGLMLWYNDPIFNCLVKRAEKAFEKIAK